MAEDSPNPENIQNGEKVWLKTGSVPMLVENIDRYGYDKDQSAFCVWQTKDGEHKEQLYKLTSLTKIKTDPLH